MSKLYLPKTIKMVITDFDGVMTDGCVYISDTGEFTRKVHFSDVMGMANLRKAGFKLGIISGERNKAIEMLAKKFNIEEVHHVLRCHTFDEDLEEYIILKNKFEKRGNKYE